MGQVQDSGEMFSVKSQFMGARVQEIKFKISVCTKPCLLRGNHTIPVQELRRRRNVIVN